MELLLGYTYLKHKILELKMGCLGSFLKGRGDLANGHCNGIFISSEELRSDNLVGRWEQCIYLEAVLYTVLRKHLPILVQRV